MSFVRGLYPKILPKTNIALYSENAPNGSNLKKFNDFNKILVSTFFERRTLPPYTTSWCIVVLFTLEWYFIVIFRYINLFVVIGKISDLHV